MQKVGCVEIPQEAFLAVLKVNDSCLLESKRIACREHRSLAAATIPARIVHKLILFSLVCYGAATRFSSI